MEDFSSQLHIMTQLCKINGEEYLSVMFLTAFDSAAVLSVFGPLVHLRKSKQKSSQVRAVLVYYSV